MIHLTKYHLIKKGDIRLERTSEAVALEEGRELGLALKRVCESIPEAVGLAAPQLGINKRVFVANGKIYINPRLIGRSWGSYTVEEESCLSLPGESYMVDRFRVITVHYTGLTSGKQRKTRLTDHEARVFQHEFDHLDGVLISSKKNDDDEEDYEDD